MDEEQYWDQVAKAYDDYMELECRAADEFDRVVETITGKQWIATAGEHEGETYEIFKTEFYPYVSKYTGGTIWIKNTNTEEIHYLTSKQFFKHLRQK